MSTAPGTTVLPTVLARLLLPAILAISLIASLVYYGAASVSFLALRAGGDGALLGTSAEDAPKVPTDGRAVRALAASPLDQQAVNGTISIRARVSGNMDRALQEAGLLRSLGWRSNAALQNMLWRGGKTNDIPLIMDTLDAMLRRERLLAQIYPVLNLMTVDPMFRRLLTRRLEARPPWRRYYFMSASDLVEPRQIEGRYEVMRAIQQRGDRLTRNEIAPILPKLIGIGKAGDAFGLWQAHSGSLTRPLADTQFAAAARAKPDDALPVPFEWQLGSGGGFFVDASLDAGGSFLSIEWDGRGVPALLSQLTTAGPGRYRLEVTGAPPMATVADKIGFTLVCADGSTTEFMPAPGSSRARLQLLAAGPVRCSYPELRLTGLVQPSTSAGSIVLRSIRLVRLGG